jgi:hypothetical protein
MGVLPSRRPLLGLVLLALPAQLAAGTAADECSLTGRSSRLEVDEETACSAVVHIGDSTSLGLEGWHRQLLTDVEPVYPSKNAFDLIATQYRMRGVALYSPEISNGRSIVEHFTEQLNAVDVARQYRSRKYDGCWVVALGLNDAATVEGDLHLITERIEKLMEALGAQPVLWVSAKTLRPDGDYRGEYLENWNLALAATCPYHPDMRIYDWASEARREWFATDGIHFTPGEMPRGPSASPARLPAPSPSTARLPRTASSTAIRPEPTTAHCRSRRSGECSRLPP